MGYLREHTGVWVAVTYESTSPLRPPAAQGLCDALKVVFGVRVEMRALVQDLVLDRPPRSSENLVMRLP